MATTKKKMPDKDPVAVLDYQVDLTSELAGDALGTVTWSVPDGLTLVSESNDDKTATIWLSGGTDGQQYVLSFVYVTTDGRTDARSFILPCRSRQS